MHRLWRVHPLVLAVALAACSSSAPPAGTIPTIEEARATLDRAVTLARSGDFEGLCALGDANCPEHLEVAGRDNVPADPPTIVATRTIPTTTSAGDQTHLGGIVFVLCGVDANGAHYDSEMLIFHGGNGLQVINPVYWSTTRITDSANPVSEESFPPVTC